VHSTFAHWTQTQQQEQLSGRWAKKSAPAAARHLSLSTLAHPGLNPWLRAEKPAAAASTVRPPLLFQPLSGVVIAQPWCGSQCCWDCCTAIPMWCWACCCLVGPCLSRWIFIAAAVHHACKLQGNTEDSCLHVFSLRLRYFIIAALIPTCVVVQLATRCIKPASSASGAAANSAAGGWLVRQGQLQTLHLRSYGNLLREQSPPVF